MDDAESISEPAAGDDAEGAAHSVEPRLGDPVPIAVVPAAGTAYIVKGVLEDAGIRAAIVGEHASSLLPHLSAVVSVQVLVARPDYERAAQAIREAVMDSAAPYRCSACGYDLGGLEEQERCPECGAKYVDLKSRIAIAPPPGPASDPIARFGAIIGVIVLVCMVLAVAAFVIWGML
jgi:DNA-directed RNA polymerase subunit RPC12/RpoP